MDELKELLLQKGIDPSKVDEIVTEMAQTENSSPLEALKKAVDKEPDITLDSLFKAKKGEGDDDDDDEEYDEAFMKKMKKYMKSKGKHDEPDGDEGGEMFGKMKKAIDDIDHEAEGGVIEMADLKPVLESITDTFNSMSKAISDLSNKIEIVSEQNSASYQLMSKAAAVQIETAETISEMSKVPSGRKGKLMADMEKAQGTPVDVKQVWSVLAKAINSGDIKAGEIGSKFESAGKRWNFLNQDEQKYVTELIKKEAN